VRVTFVVVKSGSVTSAYARRTEVSASTTVAEIVVAPPPPTKAEGLAEAVTTGTGSTQNERFPRAE